MSKILASFEDLDIAQFCGNNHKLMLQVTQNLYDIGSGNANYIQLNKLQAYQLVIEITKWLKDMAVRDKDRIKTIIEENKELEKSLFKDALDCEKFISDLKIIEIPLKLLELN